MTQTHTRIHANVNRGTGNPHERTGDPNPKREYKKFTSNRPKFLRIYIWPWAETKPPAAPSLDAYVVRHYHTNQLAWFWRTTHSPRIGGVRRTERARSGTYYRGMARAARLFVPWRCARLTVPSAAPSPWSVHRRRGRGQACNATPRAHVRTAASFRSVARMHPTTFFFLKPMHPTTGGTYPCVAPLKAEIARSRCTIIIQPGRMGSGRPAAAHHGLVPW